VSKDYTPLYGRDVDVISGPHQGRSGRVLEIRDVSLGDGREPEGYAIVEYREKNCFDEVQTDQISVPIRRLTLRG
jgi:hypothetical protein